MLLKDLLTVCKNWDDSTTLVIVDREQTEPQSLKLRFVRSLYDACAIRNFEHAVRQPDSLLRSHPNDYSLFKVGTYDNVGGYIEPIEPPVMLCDAAQCLKE